MSDLLLLRSVKDLMESETTIRWNNKHDCPIGYAWNEEGYVITDVPYPFLRSCIGLRFRFLIVKLGLREYLKQNLIVLRLLNEKVHKAIIGGVFSAALRRTMLNVDKKLYDEVLEEVFALSSAPPLDNNFVTWRRTWFSADCAYDRVSSVVRAENSNKIDADRELMRIDEKYITDAVAKFTGFSRHRIDNYWSEKQWTKKLRTLYTLEEAYESLVKQGVTNPTQFQLAAEAGLSRSTVVTLMMELKKMINDNDNAICQQN